MSDWNAVPIPSPGPRPTPGPIGADAQRTAAETDPARLRTQVQELVDRIDAETGAPTELFESAHELLLRALGTVDRA